MQRLLLATSLILLTGCNGIEIQTNAGTYVSDKVKSTLIEEYSLAEIHRSNGTLLGTVSANSCQALPSDEKPEPASIKKSLKIKTHNLGGNAIVFESCTTQNSAGCLKFIECNGLAYIVPQHNEQEIDNPPYTPSHAF
ncbi:Rcs stress response system protein RcsF [Microbulbifer sp. JMSA004]|uniref:Rcs stress response system protein RcsF n=1 Tax=unclassified Microbulbifer TaxID=2619833 RepID=UPI0024ADFB24|nr:Rcs stress response system protein RcsF [Microbulbifer sp. VAAF005]WHI46658.1 Rcs stress response system protein RcsF [Microbulbifer sp. VAAF005]